MHDCHQEGFTLANLTARLAQEAEGGCCGSLNARHIRSDRGDLAADYGR